MGVSGDDIDTKTLLARLQKGADLIWGWEQEGQRDDDRFPKFQRAINLFRSLLAQYEMAEDA